MKKILFSLVYILIYTSSFSQGKTILVYSSNGNYLVGYIEKTLQSLKINNSFNNVFSKVTNLNQVTTNIISESTLRESVDFFSKQYIERNDASKEKYKNIANTLLSHDYLLIVNSNLIFDVIEFQFYLYEVSKVTHTERPSAISQLPVIDTDRPTASENFIVNLKSETSLIDLRNGIKRLFPIVNSAPVASISISNDYKLYNNFYYVSLNDTLILESNGSFDKDTDKDKWQFNWRQIDLNGRLNIPDTLLSHIKNNNDQVFITFDKVGEYKFGLSIFDGISLSNEDTISINIVEPVKFILDRDEIVIYEQSSVFSNRTPKNNFSIYSPNYKDKTLHININKINKIDTYEVLKQYSLLRKKYENELYYHTHGISNGMKIYYPPPPKPLPGIYSYINELNKDVIFTSKNYTEGINIGIQFDTSLFNTYISIYFEEHGVESEHKNLKIVNKFYSYTAFKIEFSNRITPEVIINKETDADTTSIHFSEITGGVKINLFKKMYTEFSGSFSLPTEVRFNLDTVTGNFPGALGFALGLQSLPKPKHNFGVALDIMIKVYFMEKRSPNTITSLRFLTTPCFRLSGFYRLKKFPVNFFASARLPINTTKIDNLSIRLNQGLSFGFLYRLQE